MVMHGHQPVGNFDGVVEEAYRKSYQPFLEHLSRHPAISLALHYSGILLEWLAARHPEFIDQLGALVGRGQVELVGGGYYEPILAAIPDEDKITQIQKQSAFVFQLFGVEPRGLWVGERVWEQGLVRPLVEAGAAFTILDDTHFLAAGLERAELHGAYLTEDAAAALMLVPSLQSLRYTIPFREPDETLAILREGREQAHRLFAVGDDCEKFGVWPGTYEHCYVRGWLERFFHAIESESEWLETLTLSEYLEAHPPTQRVYIPSASYAEMMMWALPASASMEFQSCLDQTQQLPRGEQFRRFLRGGSWRNFLSKYAESNQLHKLVLAAGRRAHELACVTPPGSERQGLVREARNHLLAAQCNDAYWHGIFGGLYAPHLRSALYGRLVEAESLLDRAEGLCPDSAARASIRDFDVDGEKEILVEHCDFGATLRPADGGTVSSLRFKPCLAELVNSIARRPEAYHHQFLQSGNQHASGNSAPVSIHEASHAKDLNLAASLRYDRYARHAFRTYLFPPGKACRDFEALDLQEVAALAASHWSVVSSDGSQEEFHLQCEAALSREEREVRVTARKDFAMNSRKGAWSVDCDVRISAEGVATLASSIGIELVFNLLAPGAPDRYFTVAGQRYPLEYKGEFCAERIALVDEWLRVTIDLRAPLAKVWWVLPIETVSQSESGLERVYQGSAIMPVWEVDLASPEGAKCRIESRISKLE
jgi:4-alpha-glucanotransferase